MFSEIILENLSSKMITSGPLTSEPAEQADMLQELHTLLNIIIMVHLEGGIILVSLGFKI